MKYFNIILILLTVFDVNAQCENIWTFGTNAGLDFNSGVPIPIRTSIQARESIGGESYATVCDSNGGLLFYTDGSYVWDRNNNLMPNSSNLTGLDCGQLTPTISTVQGAVIIPMPDSANLFYLFSLSEIECFSASPGREGRLYYSILDMNLNNGFGDIMPGRKGIFIADSLTESMTAVVGDNCNVWLLTVTVATITKPSNLCAFEINSNGLNTKPVLSPCFGGSQMSLSPNRKLLGVFNTIFDFDPLTGKVTNPRTLNQIFCYGACFSPDNSKAYFSSMKFLYQYDLSQGNDSAIISSEIIVCNKSGVGNMKLGPDDKIYFCGSGESANKLGCINKPNLAGLACQPIIDAVTFLPGTSPGIGLPNVVPVIKVVGHYNSTKIDVGCWSNHYLLQAKTGGWDYVWNNGLKSMENKVDQSGTYWVTYRTPPCNKNIDTFHVQFDSYLPQLVINSSCKNAINGRAYLALNTLDTLKYHYQWQKANDTVVLSTSDSLTNIPSGFYTVKISTIKCDTVMSFYLPEVSYEASFYVDTIICQNVSVEFKNTSDVHFDSFNWFFGDQDSSIVYNPVHKFLYPGNYYVQLIAKGDICTDTISEIVIVDEISTLSLTKSSNYICSGQSIIFTPSVDSTTLSLQWDYGDDNIILTLNDITEHAYSTSGIMPVQLNAKFRACPEANVYDTVNVYPIPNINLGSDNTLCLKDQPITLSNHVSTKSTSNHYQWSTGEIAESIIIRNPGIYSLTVTNQHNCSNTEKITVNKDCYTDIPNVFTPNGDGINDYFFPRQRLSRGIVALHLQIWSRWGQLLFETRETDGRGWDGKWNGQNQTAATYLYQIKVRYSDAQEELLHGNVTLVR